MTDSQRIITALQANSAELLSTSWIEAWGYRASDRPMKFTVQHIVDPQADGSYKLRTSIGFGIRIVHQQAAEVAAANDARPKLSSFPTRGNANAAAA